MSADFSKTGIVREGRAITRYDVHEFELLQTMRIRLPTNDEL
jgi:hypothetical protein